LRLILRDYQRRLIARAQAAYRMGHKAVLMQSPTGSGKSATAIEGVICPSVALGRSVIFCAHLEEILDDAAGRIAEAGLTVSIVKSGRKLAPNAQVYVCSTPTLARMLERGEALPAAQRVILDEAHRAASSTNRAILTHYRSHGALILGLTATPSRGDGQPLDEFEQLVTGPSVRELVAMGNLVPCQVFAPDRVLERGMAKDPVCLIMGDLIRGDRPDARVVVFAPDGASAQVIHERLCTAGYRTETVLDGTPGEIRRGVRDRLKSGETRGIVTVRAVVEGFDAPVLDTAVLCGAFTTITPWLQAIGRVTRAFPGKTHARVYDLRGAVYLHGLPEDDRVWSLAGEQGRSATDRPAGLRTCRACHAVFPPCTRCPRCGSVLVSDPRPMRVQRAEMFEASQVPVGDRAARYVASVEKKLIERGMPARVAGMRARERAPSWVREALAGVGETQRRAG
jgi:superfamily II DNA or RNA helicase